MSSRPHPARRFDPACPVEWDHPRNRGRRLWWLTPPNPGWRGGLKFRDLVRGGRAPSDAAFAGSPTWVSSSRPGGFGALRCAATGAGAVVAAPPALQLGLPITWGVWLRSVGTPDNNSTIFGCAPNATNASPFLSYSFYSGSAGQFSVGLNSGGLFAAIASTRNTSTLTGWTRVVAVLTAADLRIYLNGVLDTTSTSARSAPTYTAATATLFAGNTSGVNLNTNVELDDGFVVSGEWSPGLVWADYRASRLGYPDEIRWLTGLSTFWMPQAGAPGNSAGTSALALDPLALAASGTASAPADSAGTSALSLAALTLSGTASAATPGNSAGASALTLADIALAASGTSAAPGNSAGTSALALGAVVLAASGSSSAPGNAAGTSALALADIVLAASASSSASGSSAGAAALALGAVTLAASGTSTAPGNSAGTSALTLGAVALAGSGTYAATGNATGTAALALGSIGLAAAGVSSGGVAGPAGLPLRWLLLLCGGESGPEALNLKAAIALRFYETSALVDNLPGGLWDNVAPRGVEVPYAVLREVADSTFRRNTGRGFVQQHSYVISFFGEDTILLEDMKYAWLAAFNHLSPRLESQRGVSVKGGVWSGGGFLMAGEGLSPAGKPMLHQTVEMTVTADHQLPSPEE